MSDEQSYRKDTACSWESDMGSKKGRRIYRGPKRGGWKSIKKKFNKRQRHLTKQKWQHPENWLEIISE